MSVSRNSEVDDSILLPSSKEAINAVATLLAQSRTAWPILKLPSGIQPKMTAAMEARKPTTVAWTWKQEGQDELGHLFWPSRLKFKVFRLVHVKFTLFSFIISVHMTLLGFGVISKKKITQSLHNCSFECAIWKSQKSVALCVCSFCTQIKQIFRTDKFDLFLLKSLTCSFLQYSLVSSLYKEKLRKYVFGNSFSQYYAICMMFSIVIAN